MAMLLRQLPLISEAVRDSPTKRPQQCSAWVLSQLRLSGSARLAMVQVDATHAALENLTYQMEKMSREEASQLAPDICLLKVQVPGLPWARPSLPPAAKAMACGRDLLAG